MESSDSDGRDRRRYERFEFDGFAEVISFHPEVLFRGAVKDISLTGCYVETRARLNLKRFAEIELRFSANGQQLSALARVMDVRPGKGIGVEFIPGLESESAGHLRPMARPTSWKWRDDFFDLEHQSETRW